MNWPAPLVEEQIYVRYHRDNSLRHGCLRIDHWQSNGTSQTRLVLVVQKIHSIKPFSKTAPTCPGRGASSAQGRAQFLFEKLRASS